MWTMDDQEETMIYKNQDAGDDLVGNENDYGKAAATFKTSGTYTSDDNTCCDERH